MSSSENFDELIRRVRAGDPEAAESIWRRYEPLLQREIRLRIRDPRLRRRVDESDICQSVMMSFFARVRVGQFELEGPEQLQRLLAQMGKNKLASQARRHGSDRRNYRQSSELPDQSFAGKEFHAGNTPSQVISWQEILERFLDRLNEDERQMANLRVEGESWSRIAEALGGTADGRRVQFHRAIDRIAKDLGLNDVDEM